jgi:hypothetical protein
MPFYYISQPREVMPCRDLFYPDRLQSSDCLKGVQHFQNNLGTCPLGYGGRIFGVNPRSDDIHVEGSGMYRNIEDLPEVPGLAYV